jgi:predicted NAD-dependent protein-ADP-ribosyltransferase YbiA (DUF1768 family)
LFLISCSSIAAHDTTKYPAAWWEPFPKDQAASWEILPQDAKEGEVILSKRTELGILSNFAATPIVINNKKYPSLEGYWQMMKYPDPALKDDPRAKLKWDLTRAQVSQLVAFEAKAAGDIGTKNMKALGIDWVSLDGQKMIYKSPKKSTHYKIILDAMWAKVNQNPEVKRILLATGDLKLRADHNPEANSPPEWLYNEVWMEIRSELQK